MNLLTNFWLFALILFSFSLIVFLGLKILLKIQRKRYAQKQTTTLLQIQVSRLNEKLPIVAEQILAILHGTLQDISFYQKLQGVTVASFAFEIVNLGNQIKFFILAPTNFKNFVSNQIYAQYPDVEITEVPDYLNSPEFAELFPREKLFKKALSAELSLSDSDIYPIKRHAQFEDKITRTAVDPLSGITSALSKLPYWNDLAAIQIVVKPLGGNWRITATKCARMIGKNVFFGIEKLQKIYAQAFLTRKIWPRIVFFPIYFVFFFQGLFSASKTRISLSEGEISDDDVLEANLSRQHERENVGDATMDKVIKLVFDCSLRVLFYSEKANPVEKHAKVQELTGSFKQFNQPHLNGFRVREFGTEKTTKHFLQRAIHEPFVLNTEELATIWHLPTIQVKTPNIFWVNSKKLEPPVDLPNPELDKELTTLGQTNFRGGAHLVGIKQVDRRRHIYIVGKTGMGKSTLLENMILSDIQAGRGVAVVDPHGDLAEHILAHIPAQRTNDVVIFDPSDRDFPVAFNLLENLNPEMHSIVASGLVGIFKKIYAESWGPRLEHILRNTILSLLESPGMTMLGIPRLLSDPIFRKKVTQKIQDPVVKKFWFDEFERMQERQRTEAIAPIQNKVGQFLSSSIIRNIVGQPRSQINLRFIMDNKRIFICNLSKGKIGEDNSSLLGAMVITKFQIDAMSRSNIPEKDRVDFYLYVDEFQNFATDSFATILSEARKYRLNLTMANQYIAQMSDEVRDAVFGNVGTLKSFQVGFDDAEYLSKQFSELVLPEDLVQLPKYNLYTKLLIEGMPSQPFSATTLPPDIKEPDPERLVKVLRHARERYAAPRKEVEDKILRWSEIKERPENSSKKNSNSSGKNFQMPKSKKTVQPESKIENSKNQNPKFKTNVKPEPKIQNSKISNPQTKDPKPTTND